MNSWMFNHNGAKKIIQIHESFVSNRVSLAQRMLPNLQIKSFHPVFSDSKVYTNIDSNLLENLITSRSLVDLSLDAQRARKNVYEGLDFLDWFNDKDHGVEIDEEITNIIPEAQAEVFKALSLMQSSSEWMYNLFNTIIYELCFVKKNEKRRFIGGSSDYRLLGTIFCNLKPQPNEILELGICLAHELGHQALMVYQTGKDPISKESHNTVAYSGVRKVERPIYGSFHACVALGYMVLFCRDVAKNHKLENEIRSKANDLSIEYTHDLTAGLSALNKTQFTDIGALIMKDLIRL